MPPRGSIRGTGDEAEKAAKGLDKLEKQLGRLNASVVAFATGPALKAIEGALTQAARFSTPNQFNWDQLRTGLERAGTSFVAGTPLDTGGRFAMAEQVGQNAQQRVGSITGNIAAAGGQITPELRAQLRNIFVRQEGNRANELKSVGELFGSVSTQQMINRAVGSPGTAADRIGDGMLRTLEDIRELLRSNQRNGGR